MTPHRILKALAQIHNAAVSVADVLLSHLLGQAAGEAVSTRRGLAAKSAILNSAPLSRATTSTAPSPSAPMA
jgi:hypothetical protein